MTLASCEKHKIIVLVRVFKPFCTTNTSVTVVAIFVIAFVSEDENVLAVV